jgi:hypothetical protein
VNKSPEEEALSDETMNVLVEDLTTAFNKWLTVMNEQVAKRTPEYAIRADALLLIAQMAASYGAMTACDPSGPIADAVYQVAEGGKFRLDSTEPLVEPLSFAEVAQRRIVTIIDEGVPVAAI